MVTAGGIMTIVVTLRLNAAMLIHYYDYHGNPEQQRKYLQSLFSFSLFMAIGAGLIFAVVGEPIFRFVFKSDAVTFYPYGFIILLYSLLSEVNICYYTYLKNQKNLKDYIFIVVSQMLMAVLFQFLFIIVLRAGVEGALMGMLLSNVVTILMIFLKERDILTFRPDMKMIKKSLRFSIALIPYLLIYWVLTKGGKIMLERQADLTLVGAFALMLTLTNIILFTSVAVVNGIRPFLFELFSDKRESNGVEVDYYGEKVDLLTKVVISIPLFMIPFIICISCNISLITSKASYHQIGDYINLACLAIFLLVYCRLFYQQMIFAKRSGIVTRLSFIVLIVLIIGFTLWAEDYKVWGVLAAMTIANLLMAILFYFQAQKHQPVNYNKWSVFFVPILFFIMLFGMEWVIIEKMEMSRALFGIVQLLILVPMIVVANYNTVGEYRALFIEEKS